MSNNCPLCVTASTCDQHTHALHIATLEQTHVILGDNQGCPGWCVCVLRDHVEHLDTLSIQRQQAIFGEVANVARAIRAWSVSDAQTLVPKAKANTPPRINYESLGNVVPHIHWHIIPRHATTDPDLLKPVWGWTPEQLRGTLSQEQRRELAATLHTQLTNTLQSNK